MGRDAEGVWSLLLQGWIGKNLGCSSPETQWTFLPEAVPIILALEYGTATWDLAVSRCSIFKA